MHGSMMLFLFAIPMLEGIAVYLTPKILGTRDFAFPRLTAYGYWCYLFGGTILTVVAGRSGSRPTAAGSCTRRSARTSTRRASTPTSGCSA